MTAVKKASMRIHKISFKFMHFYFPSKLIRLRGLRVLPFMATSLPLYFLYDFFYKRFGDTVLIWKIKPPLPIVLFTPTCRIIPCPFTDFSTLAILHEIYVEAIYRKLPSYEPKAGWIVVDAGANVGLFSLYAMDHQPKRVVALEPVAKNYQRLTTTFRANNITVIALYCAISSVNGYLEFAQSNDSATSHIASGTEKCLGKKIIRVRTLSLTYLVKTLKLPQIDLLKLDVEGAEYGIIASSTDLLESGYVKRIVGELHGEQKDFDALVYQLRNLGFKVEYLVKTPPVAFIHATHAIVASAKNQPRVS